MIKTNENKRSAPLATLLLLVSLLLSAGSLWAGKQTMLKASRDIYAADPTEAECRFCHEDLTRFPILGDSNPNKHHVLIGADVARETAPESVELGDYYTCMSCHPYVNSSFLLIRDCL